MGAAGPLLLRGENPELVWFAFRQDPMIVA